MGGPTACNIARAATHLLDKVGLIRCVCSGQLLLQRDLFHCCLRVSVRPLRLPYSPPPPFAAMPPLFTHLLRRQLRLCWSFRSPLICFLRHSAGKANEQHAAAAGAHATVHARQLTPKMAQTTCDTTKTGCGRHNATPRNQLVDGCLSVSQPRPGLERIFTSAPTFARALARAMETPPGPRCIRQDWERAGCGGS